MLFSTAYFPPVEYFAKIAEDFALSGDCVKPSVIYLEACENYQKQSYRNRCKFYAENGVQTLSFPVKHEGGTYQLPITEIKVDRTTPWLIQTERAICSAYESSAFFDYYKDDLFNVLAFSRDYLFDMNIDIINFFLEKVGIKAEIRLTTEFTPKDCGKYGEDLRETIHPKRENNILKSLSLDIEYFQVFSQKHGFIPNLSIMDLLFNEGPSSIMFLKK